MPILKKERIKLKRHYCIISKRKSSVSLLKATYKDRHVKGFISGYPLDLGYFDRYP